MAISIPERDSTVEKPPCPDHLREDIDVCDIQLSYSILLGRLTKLGFAVLLVIFFLYLFGILDDYVPKQLLPHYWSHPLNQYLRMTEVTTGWSWLGGLHFGDFLILLPLAFLASITAICLLSITLRFFRGREPLQGILAILEIIVLVVAASGLLKVGGH
ncbi:MAG: hypothetical protein FJ135_10870 [Deltaproteobacteria bacterium]|nr:hypothetical protein [Deltaproteobacteria bacterium]